jgi:hypothetical protein
MSKKQVKKQVKKLPVKKSVFFANGYSDDNAGMTGTEEQGYDDYSVHNRWFELLLDGKVVGRCQMEHTGGGWEFRAELEGHDLRAGKCLEPEDEPEDEG